MLPGTVVTLSSAISDCIGGAVLELGAKDDDDTKQKWRFYDNGIVNLHCGRESGNLAVTQINDDSFRTIQKLDDIKFSIVNSFK